MRRHCTHLIQMPVTREEFLRLRAVAAQAGVSLAVMWRLLSLDELRCSPQQLLVKIGQAKQRRTDRLKIERVDWTRAVLDRLQQGACSEEALIRSCQRHEQERSRAHLQRAIRQLLHRRKIRHIRSGQRLLLEITES